MKNYHDIVGDGGSKVLEQVQAKQAGIRERLAGVRHRVAVGSGKGGVGKSTVTQQLAQALTRQGRRCAILDADVNGPSQARLAGLTEATFVPGQRGLVPPRNEQGIGVVSFGSVVPEAEAVEFDSVSSGESHTWRATREFSALGELLGGVEWGELDALLIDLPPGAERTFQYAEFFGPETGIVLVTVPSDLSRGVVSRSIDSLSRTRNPVLGYVENMCGYWCADCGKIQPLFPDTGAVALDVPRLGRVPFDPELAAASDRGLPLQAGAGPTSTALDGIARAVWTAMES